jgi:hypothetical protein
MLNGSQIINDVLSTYILLIDELYSTLPWLQFVVTTYIQGVQLASRSS